MKGLKGNPCHVQGTRGDKTSYGWKVLTCITSETLSEATVAKPAPDLPPDVVYEEEGNANNDNVKEKRLCDRTSIKSQLLVPLIQSIITERPNVSNKELNEILKYYVRDIFLTAFILQNTQSDARAIVFGNVNKNVQYIDELVRQLEAAGHDVLITTHPSKEVQCMLDCIIINQQITKLKAEGKNGRGHG